MAKAESESHFLYAGLIRLHVLHHAAEEPIFGLGMMRELEHHGYRISPGTLYPLLQSLEKRGYIKGSTSNGSKSRRTYSITPKGRLALADAKAKVSELFGELFENVMPRKKRRSLHEEG
jgi:DNA-binding PadR family transcriptional regulator